MVKAILGRGWRAALLGGCALTTLWVAAPVWAADQVPAAAVAERSFKIAAQSLAGALTQFGQQAGVQLSVEPSVVAGRSSAGLTGTMSAMAALATLLDGTGIGFRFTDANTVVLQKVAANSGAVLLNPVTIEGGSAAATVETGDGPVAGYVARRTTGATKTDVSLLDTPQSVTVITRDQMEAQDVQRLNEVLRYTAGVVPETRGSVATRYDMYTIRGFDSDTYWNGLKLTGNGWYILPQLDPYFMERVDVMKGTSSALYGQAKAGGIVNQTGKAPTAAARHEVGFEAGTDAHMRATADMSGPVAGNDRVLYRVVGVGLSEDGQQDTT